MTRKRCRKLLMANGLSRNEATRIMRILPVTTNRDKFATAWPLFPVQPLPALPFHWGFPSVSIRMNYK